MIPQPTRIVFVTDQPSLTDDFCEVVRQAGFKAEPVVLRPRNAFAGMGREDTCLIFVDAKRAPAMLTLAQVVRNSPRSRFVLYGSAITPEMLLMAIESGMHGLLASSLPVDEATQAVARIWNGEKQFRFDCASHRLAPPLPLTATAVPPAVPPTTADSDFDSAWMFGQSI